ncbi:MAG: histidine kinase [Chitinophagaceae bacterium]
MELLHNNKMKEATLKMQKLTMEDIGREIHDGVGQRLTLASIYTSQLLSKKDNESFTDKLKEIGAILNDSLAQLRALSKELTQEQTYTIEFIKLLKSEVEKIKALEICTVELEYQCEIFLDYKKALFIFRIAQEFIQNSLKHAACKNIKIGVKETDEKLIIHMNDDGIGFEVNTKSSGIGLRNMQKRAELIGAEYIITSSRMKGTAIKIQLPLN